LHVEIINADDMIPHLEEDKENEQLLLISSYP
jgi:hypothetical protein